MKAELHVEHGMAKQVILTCTPMEYLTIQKAIIHMTDIRESDIKDAEIIERVLSNPVTIEF